MAWLLIGVASLLALLVLGRLLAGVDAATMARVLRWVGITLAVVLAVAMLVRGLSLFAGLLGGVAMFLWRARRLAPLFAFLWRARQAAAAGRRPGPMPPPSGDTTVETGWLRMALDHATGDFDGEVLQGRFAGRRLSSLALPELFELYGACAGDERSRRLLESFLDRSHGDWREAGEAGAAGGGDATTMSRVEALAVLGLGPDAKPSDIKAAHRRLMQRHHPDHGGSDSLAAKINRAKDVLLGD